MNQNHFYKFDEIWQNLTQSFKISSGSGGKYGNGHARIFVGVYLMKFIDKLPVA